MLHLGPSAADLVKAVVDIQRRFLADPDSDRAFRDVLGLVVQLAGSPWGCLLRIVRPPASGTSVVSVASFSSDDEADPASCLTGAEIDWEARVEQLSRAGRISVCCGSGSCWCLPCCDECGGVLGVIALAPPAEESEEDLQASLLALCDLCGVMLETDRLELERREQSRYADEARYRKFADHTTDGLFIHDLEGRMVDVNRSACESLGYTREELIGLTPFDFDSEVTADLLVERMERLARGESLSFESRHRRRDGSTFPVEIRVSPFQHNGEQFALALVCDITQRKLVQEKLRESEAKFRALAINAPIAIFIKDADSKYALANPLACEALGRPAGVAGLTDYDLVPREIADKFRKDDLNVLETGIATQYEDFIERDGYSRHFLTVKFPLLDAQGNPNAVCGVAIDITERKAAEEALRESEERFRVLVNMTSQIVWTVGAQGEVDRPVPTWEAFTGQPFEESINEGWANVLHPDDRERTLTHWHQCNATGEPFEIEYRLWHAPTQSWRWTEVNGVCLRDEAGNIRSWVGTHNDITEKKAAADALQLSEARYRNFVDHATDGLFLQDAEGRVVDVNRQACVNLGRTREELIGMMPYEFDPDVTPKEMQERIARLEAGEPVSFDSRHRRKDGSTFPVEVRIRPFWVDDRRFAISLVQDITERKRAERSLKLTQFSVDHAAIAVFWVSRDSTIRYVNDVACKSLRYTRDELVGKSIMEITDHTPESWERRFEEVKRQGSVTFESQHKRSDGTQFPIEATVHFDEFDGDEFLFAFAHDITSRKEAELRFEQQAAELLHASRLSTVGEMVAALSHEVAQPLSAIGNFAAACEKIISSSSASGSEELPEYIDAIIKQNRRCAAILQRLRDFSKRSPDCRTDCDVAHLLRESVELVSNDLQSREIEVRFAVPPDLPVVRADRVQLQQVVVNLLANARDSVDELADDRRVITLRAATEPDAVLFSVEDLGKGFDDGAASKVFEPFFTTKKNGMGMGLSICQSIVQDHGGTIEAASNRPHGASFQVRLPLPRSETA